MCSTINPFKRFKFDLLKVKNEFLDYRFICEKI